MLFHTANQTTAIQNTEQPDIIRYDLSQSETFGSDTQIGRTHTGHKQSRNQSNPIVFTRLYQINRNGPKGKDGEGLFDQAKYRQIISNPAASRRLYNNNPIAARNIGTQIYKRRRILFCSMPIKSATIRRPTGKPYRRK